MKKRALLVAAGLALAIIPATFGLVVFADQDNQLWSDALTSMRQWTNWPTTLAVILVEFPDVTHTGYDDNGSWKTFPKVFTWQDFQNMLASDNTYITPDPYNPDSQPRSPDGEPVYGSLRDYFGNMSNGAYRPTIEILNDMTASDPNQPPEWYMMPHSKSYYISIGSGNSFGPLTSDAITLAQNDGKNVTRDANRRICVIYAGNRRDGLSAYAYQGGDRYMMFERWKFGEPGGYTREYQDAPFSHIGGHAHEFAHLRDLAHATSNRWSILGDGQKNGPGPSFGACPAPLNPWYRSLNNWITLTPIAGDIGTANLVYNGTPNNYKIDLTRPSDGQAESFLVENRQFTSGFDRHLPGANGGTGGPGGLLIWNINGTDPGVEFVVDLVEADNTPVNEAVSLLTDIFRPDGAYPYQKIFDYSSPARLKFRDGTLSHFAVENYTANGTTITVALRTSSLNSNSAEATAFNGSRKLLRDSGGAYHLVYETEGEVYYQKSSDGGSSWIGFRRLSGGNGNNSYPCIAERGGTIFVVWQRQNGTTHDVYYRRYASGAWGSIQTLASNTGSNSPLPVIASPATNEVMLVYRTAGNLGWRRSTNNGSTWSTQATITGTALNSPSVAPAKTPWGASTTALAYATNVIPNASNVLIHYYNSGWSTSYNLSSGLPGNLSQHANPSIAASGDLTSTNPHTAWDAYDSQYSGRVILHKVGWGASSYYEFHYQEEDRPSITGLAGTTAEMIFRRGSDYFFTGHYNGSSWNIPLSPQSGKYPSFSLGSTQAKYVITFGSAAPYEVKLSSSTFSKAAVWAANNGTGNGNNTAYHRAVGLANTTTGGWLNVRVENFLIKHADGSFSAADFSAAPADTAVLSSTTAWAALASTPFILPADAESLIVVLSVAGDKVTGISNSQNALTLQFKAQTAADQPVIKDFPAATFASNQPFNQSNLRISMNTAGFSSGTLLRFAANLDNQKTGTAMAASLGHIYEYLDKPSSAPLKQLANQAPSLPTDFVLEQNFPNPFNPETQIRYGVPKRTDVKLRIYNVFGQVVATLVEGEQAAGTYTTTWNGLNSAGVRVSSGIYFYKLETKEFTQVRKLLLAK